MENRDNRVGFRGNIIKLGYKKMSSSEEKKENQGGQSHQSQGRTEH